MIEKQAETITWSENGKKITAVWHSESNQAQPKWIEVIGDQTKANDAYRLASEGCGMVYRGDYQNAKQLLQALSRRIDKKPLKKATTMLETFHLHRARQIQKANILNRILLVIDAGDLPLRRAPAVQEVLEQALGELPDKCMISLRALLGMIGAYEWRKRGVYIPALDANIHPYYGVYSPVRGEYLDLIVQAPLDKVRTAWDIGTGTGVIAAILAKRGVAQVIATDNNPNAIACAQDNLRRLRLDQQVTIQQADMFPKHGKADLIVCNPPWLPAKANAPIEHAVYDPNSQMLKAFLTGISAHLHAAGEAWLIMSNLAELIGLRGESDLDGWVTEAGLKVVEQRNITPRHGKAQNKSDPLHTARAKEVTSLYRLKVV